MIDQTQNGVCASHPSSECPLATRDQQLQQIKTVNCSRSRHLFKHHAVTVIRLPYTVTTHLTLGILNQAFSLVTYFLSPHTQFN